MHNISIRNEILNKIDCTWLDVLEKIFSSEHFECLIERLSLERQKKVIYPPNHLILSALRLVPFDQVKVVILGQDPYHGPDQATGLAFSVPNNIVKKPPSLSRILKEAGVKDKNICDLTLWATQGILLLNPVLTVEAHKPNSHIKWGWEKITDHIIKELSSKTINKRLVFLLWGKKAQAKECLIDARKHYIIRTSHPSPLSTKGDFMGSRCFKVTNLLLLLQGLKPIQWDIQLDAYVCETKKLKKEFEEHNQKHLELVKKNFYSKRIKN